jgi:hypothetical protein
MELHRESIAHYVCSAAVPWSWFLLRDSLGAVSLGVATLLPVLVVLEVVVLVAVVRPRLDRFRLVVDVSRGHALVRVLIAEDQHLIRGGHAPGHLCRSNR